MLDKCFKNIYIYIYTDWPYSNTRLMNILDLLLLNFHIRALENPSILQKISPRCENICFCLTWGYGLGKLIFLATISLRYLGIWMIREANGQNNYEKLGEKLGIQTFVFKCPTIWLLASSNWSLSSLALWRRAWTAAKEILTCPTCTSVKILRINKG